MTSTKKANDYKTAQIIELHNNGLTLEEVAKQAKKSLLHVGNVIARYEENK